MSPPQEASYIPRRPLRENLKELQLEAQQTTTPLEKPSKTQALKAFLARIGRGFELITREPEILAFSFLQVVAITLGYLLWTLILDWIPPEVWKTIEENNGTNKALDIAFLLWSVACVGLVALPIGILTACMGAAHLLDSTGQSSSIPKCLSLVFPRVWPLWLYSWLDAWITVKQILSRLPKKKERRSAAEIAASEALYMAWKIGTMGIIPSLITTESSCRACKTALEFVKQKAGELTLLRTGYSVLNWIVGIGAYLGAILVIIALDIPKEEVHNHIYDAYVGVALPIVIATAIIHLVIRPFYILSLFDLYCDYLTETQQPIHIPEPNPWAKKALWAFGGLALLVAAAIVLRNDPSLQALLSPPPHNPLKN